MCSLRKSSRANSAHPYNQPTRAERSPSPAVTRALQSPRNQTTLIPFSDTPQSKRPATAGNVKRATRWVRARFSECPATYSIPNWRERQLAIMANLLYFHTPGMLG